MAMAEATNGQNGPVDAGAKETNGHTLTNGTTRVDDVPNGNAPSSAPPENSQGDSEKQSNGAQGPKKKIEEIKNNKFKDRVKTLTNGPPGGFDDKPLPSAPQGYTVRFTFESAANLPPSDISTGSSDPYVHATLKASNPKRHREDPDLTHRTRTQRRTVNPEWHEQWVVANVPASGFTLKCRLYDEDAPDADDRLCNVTIKVYQVSENWAGMPPPGKEFEGRKRVMSKRAYFLKALTSLVRSDVHMTPRLTVSIEVLGKSPPPHAQMCTIGPTGYVKHFSPMIGRLTGIKVDDKKEDAAKGENAGESSKAKKKKSKSQKYE